MAPDAANTAEAAIIIHVLSGLAEPLAALIPGECEVVVHDLSLLPNSIVAVAGSLTSRRVGGPATDWLLRAAVNNDYQTHIGYESRHPDGRALLSSTIIARDHADAPIAALCINCDSSMWLKLRDYIEALVPGSMTGQPITTHTSDITTPPTLSTTTPSRHLPGALTPPASGSPSEAGTSPAATVRAETFPAEAFPADVENLANVLLTHSIEAVGVPVDLMKKGHKLQVVEDLKQSGFFLLKESAETAAAALDVTRFTIYNYLKELEESAS